MAEKLAYTIAEAVEATVHGFRSTFRDWAGDCTEAPRDIAKLALADARYDTDTLEEVLAYVWDQLCWRKTDADLVALRDGLSLEG